MTKVTVRTVMDAGITSDLINEAMNAQIGELEYAVAALCLWLTTDAAKYLCSQVPVHRVRLHKWPDVVKPFAVEARRLGQIFGKGPKEVGYAFALRRLVSLAGRTDEDADWSKELKERQVLATPKMGMYQGSIGSRGYYKIRDHTLAEVAAHAVRSLRWSRGGIDEYFERRWWNTPRGTTSFGGEAKRILKERGLPELDLQLRPIKPTVMEMRTLKDMAQLLRGKPRAVARGSTKPEPGLKRRALLALDDTGAFVAGYASDGIEGSTKIGGMVLQQSPADVAEWVSFDNGDSVWRVSNDYTNFNILHSLRSLQLVDLHMAHEWETVPDKWARDKERAHRWVAESYNHAWMTTPAGDCPVTCGLWSGHRNTARDNTVLHLVYLRCIQSVMHELFGTAGLTRKERICGDDESLAYVEWGPAACHTLVADGLGFLSQVSKGLLSRKHDEFLQLMRIPGNVPKYPVANTILTFCSGNWYKDPVRNLSTTVKDISDHAWDMVLGGLPLEVGQKVARQVLNYLMQVKDSQGSLIELEWASMRAAGAGGHPLWGRHEPCEIPEIRLSIPHLNLDMHAAQDSTIREEPVWQALGNHRRAAITAERGWESYRHVAKNWLQQQYDEQAAEVWPVRYSRAEIQSVDWDTTPINRWRAGVKRDVIRSGRAAAQACGLPPELLGTEDMWKAMSVLRPRDRAKLLEHFADRQPATIGWRWNLPPLLRAV